jgi:hypothetical protein
VNVGSVGLPFNGDRRAQYAIFDFAAGRLEVDFRRVDYDLKEILTIYESSGFLASGGVTAQLLWMELERAQPYLVPFLQWASVLGLAPKSSDIDQFFEFYDPDESVRVFFHRLQHLTTAKKG